MAIVVGLAMRLVTRLAMQLSSDPVAMLAVQKGPTRNRLPASFALPRCHRTDRRRAGTTAAARAVFDAPPNQAEVTRHWSNLPCGQRAAGSGRCRCRLALLSPGANTSMHPVGYSANALESDLSDDDVEPIFRVSSASLGRR